MKICTLLILLLTPCLASAGIFDAPASDKSINLLGTIFGTSVGSMYLGGVPNPALGRMFELLNVIVVAVGTIVVSYVGLVSVINTAQEGTTMGKKWNSIYVPLRSVVGMALLAPTPATGYSVIQSFVMWIILQGIGAADHIWNNVLADLGSGVVINSALVVDKTDTSYTDIATHAEELSKEVLRSSVCLYSMHQIGSNTNLMDPPGKFITPVDSNVARFARQITVYDTPSKLSISGDEKTARYTGQVHVGIRGNPAYANICGNFIISGEVSASELPSVQRDNQKLLVQYARDIYQHKLQALRLMHHNLSPIAKLIVEQKVVPRDPNTNRLVDLSDPSPQPSGFSQHSTSTYFNTMLSLTTPQMEHPYSEVVRDGAINGWISAGSFYFLLNQKSNFELFKDAEENRPTGRNIPNHKELNPTINNFLEDEQQKNYLKNRLEDAKIYLDNDNKPMVADNLELPSSIASTAPQRDVRYDEYRKLQKEQVEYLKSLMNRDHPDPLIAQGRFGSKLMRDSENAWLKRWKDGQLRLLELENEDSPITQSIQKIWNELQNEAGIAIWMFSLLWIVGATLAIYVPLVPYLMFTVATMGWMLFVVEAIVAAPILAVGFMLPSGDELGKITQGIMLLLNVLLRPTLMLFGFVLGTRVYAAVVDLVNFTIAGNLDSLDATSRLAWVAIMTFYGIFVVTLSNKCFALIYALPDRVLRWIGGPPEQTDASQELHGVKGGIGKVADNAKQVGFGYAVRKQNELQQMYKNRELQENQLSGASKPNNDGNTQ